MRKLSFLFAAALATRPALAQEAAGDAMASGGNALVGLLVTLIIGAIVGWIASVIMKGGGSGLVMDIILGIGGALVAGWLFPMIGVSLGSGLLGAIIGAVIGAIILILVVRLLRGAAR